LSLTSLQGDVPTRRSSGSPSTRTGFTVEQNRREMQMALAARHEEQLAENVEIGEGTNVVPTARFCTLAEMLEQFVFIKDGSQVVPLDHTQAVLALADFKNAMAASKHWMVPGGQHKAIHAAVPWLKNS
jgi:hypothetical protein